MKKTLKFLLLLVAAVVLTACGQGGGGSSDSGSTDNTADTQTTETAETTDSAETESADESADTESESEEASEETESEDQAEDESASGDASIVATTTQITDLLTQLGSQYYTVEGLMGVGVDPHGYEPSASDVDKISNAAVAAYNGLHLEGQMENVFDQLESQDKDIIKVEDAIAEEDILITEEGEPDPHVWFSVPLWTQVSEYASQQLSTFDPDNADTYAENHEAYAAELEELDAYIRERVEEVPEGSRYLVTAHDAFGYFGDEYGFEVVGLQGISTESEAGTADVSELADFIVDNQIKAIFVESSVSNRTIEALQEAVADRGFEVEIGGELYSDSLGDGEASTYIGMYKSNIDTIVDALK